jgi:hypothetical protein
LWDTNLDHLPKGLDQGEVAQKRRHQRALFTQATFESALERERERESAHTAAAAGTRSSVGRLPHELRFGRRKRKRERERKKERKKERERETSRSRNKIVAAHSQ